MATLTCPQDCTGLHALDSRLDCDACGESPYAVHIHERRGALGYWTEIRPRAGAPALADTGPPRCPTCGGALRRR